MTIKDFKGLIRNIGFKEYPIVFIHDRDYLSRIVPYDSADANLKLYLTQLILKRSFYGTYISWYADVEWFIKSFFQEYKNDYIKPPLTETIREAATMILSEDTFTKKVIGTTFMFGIIEFYAKYKLGFRPLEYNFFDSGKKEYIKVLNPNEKRLDLTIKSAFEYLQKQNLLISLALNNIDNFTTKKLTKAGIKSERWTPHKIAERLSMCRNPMLHGELHSFYDKGEYLLMLYILFHLYEQESNSLT